MKLLLLLLLLTFSYVVQPSEILGLLLGVAPLSYSARLCDVCETLIPEMLVLCRMSPGDGQLVGVTDPSLKLKIKKKSYIFLESDLKLEIGEERFKWRKLFDQSKVKRWL